MLNPLRIRIERSISLIQLVNNEEMKRRHTVDMLRKNVDILGPLFLANIDDISWRSLSGVGAHKNVLHLLPNLEVYQQQQQPLLLSLKFWANQGGIYGNALGSFGGIHLAVLAAFVCQKQPTATTVILEEGVVPVKSDINISRQKILMPVQRPSSLSEYLYFHSHFTRGTFNRIRKEFLHPYDFTKRSFARGHSKGSHRVKSLKKKVMQGVFKCTQCGRKFCGRDILTEHYHDIHRSNFDLDYHCLKCGVCHNSKESLDTHDCVYPRDTPSMSRFRQQLIDELRAENRDMEGVSRGYTHSCVCRLSLEVWHTPHLGQ